MYKIPKRAYFYWSDPNHLPWIRYLTLASFRKFNPDWCLFLYVPDLNVKQIGVPNPIPAERLREQPNFMGQVADLGVEVVKEDFSLFPAVRPCCDVIRSDYLRIYLLATSGGLWSDMDILYLNPLSQLKLPREVDAVLCFQNGFHSIGFLMAGKNEVFPTLLSKAPKYLNANAYQGLGSRMYNSVLRDPAHTARMFPGLTIHNLNMDKLYSIDSNNVESLYGTRKIPKSIFGLHWYAGSPVHRSQPCFTPDTYSQRNCLFSQAIARVVK